MQLLSAGNQYSFRLDNVRVRNTTVYRTHRCARFVVVKAHALSALFRDDVENSVGDRGMLDAVQVPLYAPLVDGSVGALRLASPTVDTLTSDHRGHAGLFSLICMRKLPIRVI